MAKVACSYRLNQSVLTKLDEIKKHLQVRLDHVADMTLTKASTASAADAVEFAINLAFEKLKNDGDIK